MSVGVGVCPVCGLIAVGVIDGMGNIWHEECKGEVEDEQ